MAGLFKDDIDDFEAPRPKGLQRHQLKVQPSGNFQDLESLLDQLGAAPVFELGNPLPQEKFMPKPRAGNCHASHNRFLLDESGD
jgi:hypothetical protein